MTYYYYRDQGFSRLQVHFALASYWVELKRYGFKINGEDFLPKLW